MTTFIKAWAAPYCTSLGMPADRWTQLAPAALLPSTLHSWQPQPPHSSEQSRTDRQTVLWCLLKNKKKYRDSSPWSPISQHFAIPVALSQQNFRLAKNRSWPQTKKRQLSIKSNTGNIPWSNQDSMDSHSLEILQSVMQLSWQGKLGRALRRGFEQTRAAPQQHQADTIGNWIPNLSSQCLSASHGTGQSSKIVFISL